MSTKCSSVPPTYLSSTCDLQFCFSTFYQLKQACGRCNNYLRNLKIWITRHWLSHPLTNRGRCKITSKKLTNVLKKICLPTITCVDWESWDMRPVYIQDQQAPPAGSRFILSKSKCIFVFLVFFVFFVFLSSCLFFHFFCLFFTWDESVFLAKKIPHHFHQAFWYGKGVRYHKKNSKSGHWGILRKHTFCT